MAFCVLTLESHKYIAPRRLSMKKEMLLRLLLCLFLACLSPSSSWAEENASLAYFGHPAESGWVELQDGSHLNIPNLNMEEKTVWRYPYENIPVYIQNQTIKGILRGPSDMAGSEVAVSISSFNTSAFLGAFQAKEYSARNFGEVSRLKLNRSGEASFALNKTCNGMYMISVIDENNSTILSALPLLVTPGEMSLDAPVQIVAGEVLTLKANISDAENVSKIFAAIMISRTDYENASVSLNSSGTEEDLNSTISLGNKSINMRGIPRISSELLMQIITLLPMDSAVGMQETEGEGAEIILITGAEWEKGNYVLICGVYSPGRGLLGIKEKMIEVI
jgi:methanogen extracellular protein (TIGR04279 family)